LSHFDVDNRKNTRHVTSFFPIQCHDSLTHDTWSRGSALESSSSSSSRPLSTERRGAAASGRRAAAAAPARRRGGPGLVKHARYVVQYTMMLHYHATWIDLVESTCNMQEWTILRQVRTKVWTARWTCDVSTIPWRQDKPSCKGKLMMTMMTMMIHFHTRSHASISY
jgi:hypothetical protein